MLSHLRRNVVAYLALFVALGGTSYAATALPRNSVDTGAIQPHAVTRYRVASNAITSAKVKDHSLYARDFAGTLPAGPRGATGARGAKGVAGPAGEAGRDGAAGPAGTTGSKGDAGGTGPKGDTGGTGPKGDTGPAGPTDAAFADDSDLENGNGPTTPTGPPTTTFKSVTLTVGAAGGKIAVTEGRVTAGVIACPGGSPVRCAFEIGTYVDGVGVPGTLTTTSVGAGGTGFPSGGGKGGLITGITAGSHTVILGIRQTAGSAAAVTFPDGRLLAIATG